MLMNPNYRMFADDHSELRWMAMAVFDARYYGSPDSSVLYVSLKLIRNLTGSQYSSRIIAEILIRPCWRVTTLASVFWIHSSVCMMLAEVSRSIELV